MGTLRGVPDSPSAAFTTGHPATPDDSEALARRTGCGKSARPGLWGAGMATSSPTRPFRLRTRAL